MDVVILALVLFAQALVSSSSAAEATSCISTGQMPGPGGSGPCPPPVSSDHTCPVTPSYQQMKDTGKLWSCPSYNRSTGSQFYSSSCTEGNKNSLCDKLDPATPQFGCCCPRDGCWTPPNFNWILATCKGSGCGGYGSTYDTRKYKDAGSQLLVNYVASYQWNSTSKTWSMVRDSSFNTDGSRPSIDCTRGDGGLKPGAAPWMHPQPGGAAAWTWGYYPAGVKGVGPPGAMFVLSVERVWNVAWYMLNQATLDRGPAVGYPNNQCPYGNNNCWAAGNSGEIDFLESAWTVNAGSADEYRRLYSTQWNQIGRSFVGDMGSTSHADGGWFSDHQTTNNYFLGTKPNVTDPYIFVAVVDQVGTFIYRIPASRSDEIWPGLSRKTAACSLGARPTERPPNNGPPCDDGNPFCALFLPNCQADKWGGQSAGHQGAANQGCKVNGQQGWCQNWWRLFDNTGQWLWPENGKRSSVQYQAPAPPVKMPWNREMESELVHWSGSTANEDGQDKDRRVL